MIDEIAVPHRISRAFIQSHAEWNFLYGSDIRRSKAEGQASEFLGEANAYPVPTLERYCPSQKVYFNDSNIFYVELIEVWLSEIPSDKPIIPCPKIGMGCSQMSFVAPKLFAYLQSKVKEIAYKNIKIIYK